MRRHDAALREAAAAHFASAKNGFSFADVSPLLPNGIVYGNQVGGGRRGVLGLGLRQPCAS